MSTFGEWVTVPANMTSSGKPERRFKMKSGEYRLTEPGTHQALDHSLASSQRGLYDFLATYDGDPSTNPGDLSAKPSAPSGLTEEQQRALIEGPEGATARVARIKQESDDLIDAARRDPGHPYHDLFTQQRAVLSDDSDSRQSALTAMRQQYAPGSAFFDTDAGKAMIEGARTNQYTGDAAGLAEFNMNQRKVGIGAIDEIVDAMGYAGTPMEEWARANENLALREYNKKFSNSYAGTGPSDEEIKRAMAEGRYFPAEGSPNPLGETGMARKSNTAQTAQVQPVAQQLQLNRDELQKYRDSQVEGLKGKEMFSQTMQKLLDRRGKN